MGHLLRVGPRPVAALAAAVTLLALLLAACGDDGPPPTPGGGGGGFDGTVVHDPPPLPAPDAIPADWRTLSLPATRMSETIVLRYPPSWTVTSSHDRPDAVPQTITLTSWTSSDTPNGVRAGGIKIDLIAAPVAEQIHCEPVAKTPAVFGGLPGFRDVMMPTAEDRSGIAKVHLFQAEHEGFRYCAVAYLGSNADQKAQEQMVAQILSTLRIAGQGGQR